MIKNKKSKRKRIIGLSCIAIGFLLLGIWIYDGNVTICTTNYTVSGDNLPKAFDGFTIAQISDLHNATFGEHQAKLAEALTTANPDLIVVTGDLIDSRSTDVNASMELMRQAVTLAPVYYVTGNHESRVAAEFKQLETQMLKAGVHVLRNTTERLALEEQSIQIIGLDDPAFSPQGEPEGAMVLAQNLKQLMEDGTYTIVLSHRPELFETYCAAKANLVFTGHAHGGQFRLPFVGGLAAPNQGFFPKYDAGSFESGNTTMIVSRGLGNSLFPFRVNNPPELVVVTLKNR